MQQRNIVLNAKRSDQHISGFSDCYAFFLGFVFVLFINFVLK